MAATMSINRVVHAALRRDLARFVDALDAFADGDERRAEQLATAWRYFDEELTRHHIGEHEIAWPALRQLGVGEDVLEQMDKEHDRIVPALATASAAMAALTSSPTAANAEAARDAVQGLKTLIEEHLASEEEQLEELYLTKVDTPEIKAMSRKFRNVSPVVAGNFFAWAQNGASAHELAALRDAVPGPVLYVFTTLFGRQYRRTIAPVWRTG